MSGSGSGVNMGYGQGANPRTAWQGGYGQMANGGGIMSQGGFRPNAGSVPTPPVETYGNVRNGLGSGTTSFNPQYGAPMQQYGNVNNMGGGFERGVAKGTGMAATGGGDPFVGGSTVNNGSSYSPPPQDPMQGHRFSLAGDVPTSAPPPSSFLGAGGGAGTTGSAGMVGAGTTAGAGGVSPKSGYPPNYPYSTGPQPIDVSQALANPPPWYPQGQYGPGPGQQDLPLTQNPNWRPNPGNVFDFSGFGRPR